MTSQLVKDLTAARALIDTPEKWCQGSGMVVKGNARSYCTLMSLIEAVEPVGNEDTYPRRLYARQALEDAVRKVIGYRPSLASWNDHPKRTHPEVLAAFDAAIASARNQGEQA